MFRVLRFSLALVLSAVAAMPAWAALSAADVEQLINKEQIFAKGVRITPFIAGEEALVRVHMTVADSLDSERCKVDAVLVAKAIVLADKSIKYVNVRYYNGDNVTAYKEAAVPAVNVRAFGAGAISDKDLIESVRLRDGDDTRDESGPAQQANVPANDPIGPGPMQTERRALLGRIQQLKGRGVGVRPFMDRFEQLEGLAKASDAAKLDSGLESLSDSVKAQEKIVADRDRAEKAALAARKAPPPPPAVPPAAKPVQAATPDPRTNLLEALKESFANNSDPHFRKFVAEQGPDWIERGRIGFHLGKLDAAGVDTRMLQMRFQRMNADARAGNAELVQKEVEWFNKQLSLYRSKHHSDHDE